MVSFWGLFDQIEKDETEIVKFYSSVIFFHENSIVLGSCTYDDL